MDKLKRELREEKRQIKRAGTKKVRRLLKQGLMDHPDEAHHDAPNPGRHSTAKLNGLDRDATRRRESESDQDSGI